MTRNGSTTTVTESDLHALVDGALSEARRLEVEAYLDDHPEDAARVRAWRDVNQGLHRLYDGVASEPVPASLAVAPAVKVRWLPRLAAAAVLLAVGGGIGWTARSAAPPHAVALGAFQGVGPTLARFAAVAHAVYSPEVRHPVEVGVDQEAHLVAWLSKRLGTELRPPRLEGLGYELLGGRLLSGSTGPVAQFMYADASGRRLTLYVSALEAAGQDTAFRYEQEGPVGVFYWIDGRFGYALSASAPKAELLGVASAVYAQLGR